MRGYRASFVLVLVLVLGRALQQPRREGSRPRDPLSPKRTVRVGQANQLHPLQAQSRRAGIRLRRPKLQRTTRPQATSDRLRALPVRLDPFTR